MAITYYQGYEGAVRFNSAGGSAAEVTQVVSWSLEVKKELHETTRYGDTYATSVGGLVSGRGSIEVIYTGDNNSLIEAVNTANDTGSAIFELYLSSSRGKKIIFNGIIDSAQYGANAGDDIQRVNCSFITTGPINTDL